MPQFFFKISGLPVTRYHGQLILCTISEKTNDQILRKLSDGQMDGQTDRQTEESDLTSSILKGFCVAEICASQLQ